MFKNNYIENFRNNQLRFQNCLSQHRSKLLKSKYRNPQSDYLLYAKSLLMQISQEIQQGLLSQNFFKNQEQQIFFALKKISGHEKSEITLKLMKAYNYLKIPLDKKYYDFFEESIRYLKSLQQNHKKFIDCIIYDRIDLSIIYLYKKMSDKKPQVKILLQKCLMKISQNIESIEARMTKEQFSNFKQNIVKVTKNLRRKTTLKNYITRLSNQKSNSQNSQTSNMSQGYLQRLQVFLQQTQNQNFQRQLKQMENNRKHSKNSTSKLSNNYRRSMKSGKKRISTSWSRESINLGQKSNKMKKSGKPSIQIQIANAVNQILQNSKQQSFLSNNKNNQSQNNIYSLTSMNTLTYTQFYLFGIVRGKIRQFFVQIADIRRQRDIAIFNIKFNGFIKQNIQLKINYKDNQSIFEKIEQKKKIILKYCQIKKFGLSYHLKEKMKINENKLIMDDACFLENNQDKCYELCGFIKLYRSLFFIKHKKQSFNIYDSVMNQCMQQRNISLPLDIKYFSHNRQQSSQYNNHKRTTLNTTKISIIKTGFRKFTIPQQPIKVIRLTNNLKCKKMYKKYKKINEITDIIRVNGHNQMITLRETKQKHLTLQNTGLSGNNKSLMKITAPQQTTKCITINNLKQRVKCIYEVNENKYKKQKISIRMKQNQYSSIFMNYYFQRKISKYYVNIRVFIVAISSPLIFMDIYVPSMQKIYQFVCNKQDVLPILIEYKKHTDMRKIFKKYIQQIKIEIKQKSVIMNLNKNTQKMGTQVLIRKIHNQQSGIFLQTISSINYSNNSNNDYKFLRQIHDVSPKMKNYTSQIFTIKSQNLFKDFKYIYYQIISTLKQSKISSILLNHFTKSNLSKKLYKILTFKIDRKIMKISGTNKSDLLIQQHSLYSHQHHQYIFHSSFLQTDPIISQLSGNKLLLYLQRYLKNYSVLQNVTQKV